MDDSAHTAAGAAAPALPVVVDRPAFETALERLRVREKAHTREGDAIAAAAAGPRWWRSMRARP